GEVVYLTRDGRRVGALVAVETAEALQAAEDEADRHAVAESLAEPGPDIPHEQVMARYAADLADYPAEPRRRRTGSPGDPRRSARSTTSTGRHGLVFCIPSTHWPPNPDHTELSR